MIENGRRKPPLRALSMRKLFVKIIQLLDGTPTVYGKRQAGQSVVELALITPILIILLSGLIEIGWFANNYLNLLDVSRVGARRAAVLQDQKSPLFWQSKYSYVPNALLSASYQASTSPYYQMPDAQEPDPSVDSTTANNGNESDRFLFRWMPDTLAADTAHHGAQACDTRYVDRAFYNEVLCTMITSMDPLTLNAANGIDDIIISGFSLQLVDPTTHPDWLPSDHAIAGNVPQEVVVGRYPTNANECDVQKDINGLPSLAPRPGDGLRDPFDFYYIGSGHVGRDVASPNVPNPDLPYEFASTGPSAITELSGYDAVGADEAHREKQVGFSLFGNHKIDNTFCVGSNWTISQVQNLMNLTGYDLNAAQQKFLPSQGLVMVEVYWEHEMLLKIPILSPVFTVVGNADGKMVIYVWAAFPLSSVEPHILFPS
jgi:hypothetical protein